MNNKQRQRVNQNSANKRTLYAIGKRIRQGETMENSKQLAQMVDRLHGTNFTGKYHGK